MIRRRGSEHGVASESFVVDERLVVARRHQFTCFVLKTYRPFERLDIALAPGIGVQVMYEVAAAHDENAVVAERPELLREIVVELRRLGFVDAELNDRNVRFWIDVTQH